MQIYFDVEVENRMARTRVPPIRLLAWSGPCSGVATPRPGSPSATERPNFESRLDTRRSHVPCSLMSALQNYSKEPRRYHTTVRCEKRIAVV